MVDPYPVHTRAAISWVQCPAGTATSKPSLDTPVPTPPPLPGQPIVSRVTLTISPQFSTHEHQACVYPKYLAPQTPKHNTCVYSEHLTPPKHPITIYTFLQNISQHITHKHTTYVPSKHITTYQTYHIVYPSGIFFVMKVETVVLIFSHQNSQSQ